MYNRNVDSTKVKAYPYSQFPNMSTDEVFAINYTYPVIIRWDSSLFNAPYLPNNPPGNPQMNKAIVEGDFWEIFDPDCSHCVNMFSRDSLFCESDIRGPLFGSNLVFVFFNNPNLILEDNVYKNIKIFPIPSKSVINLVSNESIKSYFIYNSFGSTIYSELFTPPQKLDKYIVPFSFFNSGIYIIKLSNNKNQTYYEKFIIQK